MQGSPGSDGRLIFLIEFLHNGAQLEVVTSILIEQDVATPEGSLLKMIDECLLLKCELVKAIYIVAQHLDVCKTLVDVIEFLLLLNIAATRGNKQC